MGLQKDGDLWKNMWEATLIRGPRAHCITKVKGHATKEEVDKGIATAKDKKGNDQADECATKGVNTLGLANATMWLSRRHEAYIQLMKRIHVMIIRVLQKEKELRTQKAEATKFPEGFDDNVSAFPDVFFHMIMLVRF